MSFNTALATCINFGRRVPRKVSTITVTHEFGHNFGSGVSIHVQCSGSVVLGHLHFSPLSVVSLSQMFCVFKKLEE